jgi:DNA-directed RNA polymerase alpha subunit
MHIDVLLIKLVKPAQRAIQATGFTSLEQLTRFTEEDLLAMHGIGKNALEIIKATLNQYGLDLKK